MQSRILCRIFGVLAVWACAAAGASPTLAAGKQCQAVKMPDNSTVQMCRDAGGSWKAVGTGETLQQTVSSSTAAFPNRAEVTYRGTYNFVVSNPPRFNSNNLSLGGIVGSALSSRGRPVNGQLEIRLTITNEQVSGTIGGTGLISLPVTGSTRGGVCKLVSTNPSYDVTYEGKCTAQSFSGQTQGTERATGVRQVGNFSVKAISNSDNIGPKAAEHARNAVDEATLNSSIMSDIDKKMKELGLPLGNYKYSYRAISGMFKRTKWFAFRICPELEQKCLDGSEDQYEYMGIVNFDLREYTLGFAKRGLNNRTACRMEAASGFKRSCATIPCLNEGQKWCGFLQPKYDRSLEDYFNVYRIASIVTNSDSIAKKCIKKESYDDSTTYAILQDGRDTGRRETDWAMGIAFTNTCDNDFIVFGWSKYSDDATALLNRKQTIFKTIVDSEIKFYIIDRQVFWDSAENMKKWGLLH